LIVLFVFTQLGSFIPSLSAIASSFLGVLLLALFVTYKGPSCMASMRMRQEDIEKIQRKVAARKRVALCRGEDVAVDPAQSIFWTSLYHGMYSFYLRVMHRRKDVMIGTFRSVLRFSLICALTISQTGNWLDVGDCGAAGVPHDGRH
jgi:hypothetical protein